MIIYGKDFGPMAKAELQARKYGKLIADGDMPMSLVEADLREPAKLEKATIWSFVLPIVSMLAVTIWAMWYTGGGLLPIALWMLI
jgi:Na+/H+ antiporter NhaC